MFLVTSGVFRWDFSSTFLSTTKLPREFFYLPRLNQLFVQLCIFYQSVFQKHLCQLIIYYLPVYHHHCVLVSVCIIFQYRQISMVGVKQSYLYFSESCEELMSIKNLAKLLKQLCCNNIKHSERCGMNWIDMTVLKHGTSTRFNNLGYIYMLFLVCTIQPNIQYGTVQLCTVSLISPLLPPQGIRNSD